MKFTHWLGRRQTISKAGPLVMSPARLAQIAAPAAAVAGIASAALYTAAPAAQAAPLCTSLGTTVTCAYTYTGSTGTFTVPSGVTSVTITAAGGSGGHGENNGVINRGGTGGAGSRVTRTLGVIPGHVYTVAVGGAGVSGAGSGAGGWGGGAGAGNGGHGGTAAAGFKGGGGGGASWVAISGIYEIVAPGGGGGGGAGGCAPAGPEGNGGNGTANGHTGATCTADSGGTGGAAGASTTADGHTGSNAGAGAVSGAGGGGGGGYVHGGNGGGAGAYTVHGGQGGGGGGGAALGTVTGTGTAGSNGSVDITYSASPVVSITTSSPLPDPSIGHFYRTRLSATGGTGSYVWSRAGGGLPRGLSLHSDGILSGTVNAYGSYSYTARVTDSDGHTATKTFSITVTPHADLSVVLSHNGTFRHGQKATYSIRVTNHGSAGTSKADSTKVWFNVPAGLTVTFGGSGTWWQCHKQVHSSYCTRNGVINAGASTTITVTVMVNAGAGTTVTAKAKVAPTDATWHDNTSYNTLVVQG